MQRQQRGLALGLANGEVTNGFHGSGRGALRFVWREWSHCSVVDVDVDIEQNDNIGAELRNMKTACSLITLLDKVIANLTR